MRRTQTIFLLIEDDANDVLFTRQAFKPHLRRCRLEVVSDGIEAVRYLEGTNGYEDRRRHPLPDVILLDLKMPRFSGFDFLTWLRQDGSGWRRLVPVIVLSSSDLPADVARAYALGVSSYTTKPAGWTDYRERLQVLIYYWTDHVLTPPAAEPLINPAVQAAPSLYRIRQGG